MDRIQTSISGISIQVSLSGYSFKVVTPSEVQASAWLGSERLFTTPEFQRRYDRVEISLLTPKVALVPESFFNPAAARVALAEVTALEEGDYVEWVNVPGTGAVLVYSNTIGESLSKVLSQTVLPASGEPVKVLPEMYYLLTALEELSEYNKMVASWRDGWLHLVIAQGKSLCLANVFEAPDFTTAEYFLFLSLKRLQLNPEVSIVCFRTPLDTDAEMSLYRYFKAVVKL
jgi:hypothetical protein